MSALTRTASVMSYQIDNNTPTDELSRFEPEALKYGDMQQLTNWLYGTGSSIYVQWIPDEMTEPEAWAYFSPVGIIDRVEFVPKYGKDKTKPIGRMLFVHFKQWSATPIPAAITQVHPEPHTLLFKVLNRHAIEKTYELKCRINMRPIPKVEYSCSQLTDMFERLNTRVSNEIAELKRENTELKDEIAKLISNMGPLPSE